jgi:hypothetical protein
VTNDVEALAPGQGCYAAFLTHKGKMLGDLRILDAGDELLLDCERVALQELFNLLRRTTVGRDAELHKRTLQRGLLSLIGPSARSVAGARTRRSGGRARSRGRARGRARVRLIATDAAASTSSASARTRTRSPRRSRRAGAVRVPEAAAEVIRVERGRPRYGAELDDTVIPQEAGSTPAPSRSPRAVTSGRRRSPGCTTAASRTGICAAAALRAGPGGTRCARARRSSGGSPPWPTPASTARSPSPSCAARRRPGDTVAVGSDRAAAVVVDLPFSAA